MRENTHGLTQIVYCSIATAIPARDDMDRLLQVARTRNAQKGITGMLLYADGSFFQVIEGREEVIELLFRQICLDRRHKNVTVILRESILERSFSDWSMGHVEISEREASSLIGDGRLRSLDSDRTRRLLDAFREGRWRRRIRGDSPSGRLREYAQSGAFPDTVAESPPSGDGFTYAFQPIVRPSDGRIYSYEALLRGPDNSPAFTVLGPLPPDELLAFDAHSRLLAVRMAAHLGLSTRLNLNIMPSAVMGNSRVLEELLETIDSLGIGRDRILLEILESDVVEDLDGLSSILREIRGTGLKFAIDDFGSGYAGLNLLAEFQPDLLKLDICLMRGIEGSGPRQAIVRGIRRTCLDLGIDLLAEGVETEEEFRWLRDEGVEIYQGFLFARPELESLPDSFTAPW